MPVREKVGVAVGVPQILMGMDVLMNEVHFQEEIQVAQDFCSRAVGHDRVPFLHDHGPVGDVLHNR
jgi:hypothetical protein